MDSPLTPSWVQSLRESMRMVEIEFSATIRLEAQEIEDAEGNVAQAVQNAIGHTGAQVIEAERVR